MDKPSRIAVSATEVNRGRPDPAGWRLDARTDPPGKHASQMHLAAGTAAEPPKSEVDRASVFREAANAASTFLPGARGRRHHVQTTGVAVPQGFKNVQLANEAIDYVQNLSKVATSRPSHLFSQIARDDIGRLVSQNARGELTTFKPDAAKKEAMLREFRNDARNNAIGQIDNHEAEGTYLTEREQYAILLRHANAVLLENSRRISADQLVANCSEKAMLAFDMLANKEDNPQLDVVGLAHGEAVTAFAAITGEPSFLQNGPDHAFLIIGRDPKSDIADPATWGDDTVICDPWAKRRYAVSAFKEEMALLSSTTNGQTKCETRISWPANTPYNSDPTVIYREKDGIAG